MKILTFATIILLFSTRGCLLRILRLPCKLYGDFSNVLENLVDTKQILKVVTAKGKKECCVECLSEEKCKAVNFEIGSGKCELVGRGLTAELVAKVGWVYLTTKEKEMNIGPKCKRFSPCQNGGNCIDDCSAVGYQCVCQARFTGNQCENFREFANCEAVYNAGLTTSGFYKLTNMGYHYCVMSSLGECSGVGWTLIMRTKGGFQTFEYGASYWTSSNTYSHVYALSYKMDGRVEAKYDAFNKMSFTKVCLGLDASGSRTYLEISQSASSMLSLMNAGYTSTAFGRSKWLSLVSPNYLQDNCNAEGFNAVGRVRIGIAANNEADCTTPDSFLGIGIETHQNCRMSADIVTGNMGCLSKTDHLKVMADGFLLAK